MSPENLRCTWRRLQLFKTEFRFLPEAGQAPRWNRQGNRIYYMAQNGKIMEVPLKIGSRVDATSPTLVFQAPLRAEYAVLPDGNFV
jgi:hypothetical protein